MRLPPEPFQREITAAVTKQIADAQLSANYTGHLADGLDEAREEGRAWLEARTSRRKRLMTEEGAQQGEGGTAEDEEDEDKPVQLGDLPAVEYGASDELRVTIKVRSMHLSCAHCCTAAPRS